jgi:hypothetical protein
MPYRPADFSGLMQDYTRMYALRMNHDKHNRVIETEDAQRAMDGLNNMETIYTDFVNKGKAAGKTDGQIDTEFTQKYPGLVSQAQEYFKKYAAPAWAKHGETKDDGPINIIQSIANKAKFMLTGENSEGNTVPKTVDGSSHPNSRMVELSPLELLRNTRYNIGLKYGMNPFSDTQVAAKGVGVDLDQGGGLNAQVEAQQQKAAADAQAAFATGAQGNQSQQTEVQPQALGESTITPDAGAANVGSTTTGVDPQSGKPSASLSQQTDTSETLGWLETSGQIPSATQGGMTPTGEVVEQSLGSNAQDGNRGVIGDPADPATQAAQGGGGRRCCSCAK